MILILSPAEQAILDRYGSFDKFLGTADWVEGFALKGNLRLPKKSGYVFRDYLERLDYIRDQLAKKLGSGRKIKNILTTPTSEELLAKNHSAGDAGRLNLYVDHQLPLLDQRRRMLYATYRAGTPSEHETFLSQCRSRRPYTEVELVTAEVIVARGYYQSGFVWLQGYLNGWKGFSLKTNVLDAESYPMLLLKSVL